MKSAWKNNIPDLAARNSNEVEEVNMMEYQAMLHKDVDAAAWN